MRKLHSLACFLVALSLLTGACSLAGDPSLPPTLTSTVIAATATEKLLPTAAKPTQTLLIPTATAPRKPTPTVQPATPTPTAEPTDLPVITLLFTGVIVPARCVQAALDANGNPDYPYEEVRHLITQADLAIGVFNATMSDQVVHTGCVPTYQLVGSPANADALEKAGFDMMSVATNHVKDCGLMKSWCDYTFFDTLHHLQRVNILTVGAGKNLAEALQPVVVTIHGVRFGFVSLGDSKLSEVVFAREDHPGIAFLNEENMRAAIQAARQVSDVVIAMPHWGSEDIVVPNWIQRQQAQYTVAAGADLVVGNHTHVVQAYQELDGVMVFYGLGNFVFDQGLRDHRQGAILLVRFQGTQLIGYEFIPTHVDQDGRVHIAGPEEAAEIMTRVEQASQLLR